MDSKATFSGSSYVQNGHPLSGMTVALFSNSARLTVRTADMARVLSRQGCFLEIISWQRGSADIPNHEGLGPHHQVMIPARNVLAFLLKSFLRARRFAGKIYLTMDIRFLPLLFLLARLRPAIVIYDSQELPSVTARRPWCRRKMRTPARVSFSCITRSHWCEML